MKLDQSSAATESPARKTTRKAALLAAAALIATGALGLTLGNGVPFAAAETTTPQQTVQTPLGLRAGELRRSGGEGEPGGGEHQRQG